MENIQEIYRDFRVHRAWYEEFLANPPTGSARTREEIYHDAILGLVVGDADGVPFESGWRDTYTVKDMVGYEPGMPGYHDTPIPIGSWSDDSCLTFATIDHLRNRFVPNTEDLMQRFCAWYADNAYTPLGQKRFGEGKTTVRAIQAFQTGTPADKCGADEDTALGNGSLMRILPLAFYPHKLSEVAKISAVTHAHPLAMMACVCYIEIADKLIEGKEKHDAVREIQWPQCEAFARMAKIETLPRDEIKSSCHVIETLEAALWCFLTTDNYRDCILTAVNLGRDTDTVAAVAGGLAGIYYSGKKGIPKKWIEKLQPGYETFVHFEERMVCFEAWNYNKRYQWFMRSLDAFGSVFAQLAEMHDTSSNRSKPYSLLFTFGQDEKWSMRMCLEPDYLMPGNRRLSIGVVTPPSDVCVSNYLCKGTMDEITTYLCTQFASEETLDRLQKLLSSLADKLDM